MKVSEQLKAGLALIQKGFAQKTYARTSNGKICAVSDAEACCFCSYGAMYRVVGNVFIGYIEEVLQRAALEQVAVSAPVVYINDKLGFEATVKMWTRAIELAEAEEAKS